MTTISESTNSWRPNVELAVAPASAPASTKGAPRVGNGEDSSQDSGGFKVFGDDGFTFLDFIDIINPLQHLPIIGTLYRELTDDTLDPGSRVIGGTLFLGPVGTVASVANVLIDEGTGKDMGEHVLAFFNGEEAGEEAGAPQVSATEGQPVAINAAPVAGVQVAAAGQRAIDPVTAWAMAETSYRKSAAGKAPAAPAGSASMPDEIRPDREQAAAHPASGWTNASSYTRPTAQAPIDGVDALAALRADLKAGGAVRDAKQRSASLAAATYERQQPAGNTRKTVPATPPPGAVAAEGGWFTGTMLSALGRYQDGANLGGSARAGYRQPAGLDLVR